MAKKGLTDEDLMGLVDKVALAYIVARFGGWDSVKDWCVLVLVLVLLTGGVSYIGRMFCQAVRNSALLWHVSSIIDLSLQC